MAILALFIYIILGVLVGSLISILPSLHIYNVAPIFILLAPELGIAPDIMLFFLLGNVIGFAVMNSISTIFFSAPDDTTFLVLMPSQIMLLNGRGFEVALLMGTGCLIGAMIMVAISPIIMYILPKMMSLVMPNLHWILAMFLFYILLSEFPKDIGVGTNRWERFKNGWKNLAGGYLTFALASILGFIIMYGNIMPVEAAYFGMLPALIGVFAIPSLIMNIISRTEVPKQRIQRSVDATIVDIVKGGLAGFSGGFFAAIVPALTGGMGSVIAGQATGQREESQFIISMGASRFVYYVGAFFLLFVPRYTVVRGGLANLAATLYIPQEYHEFYIAVAGIAIGCVVAFLLLVVVSYLLAKVIHKVRYDYVSIAIIVILALITFATTGVIGIILSLIHI